MRADPHELRGSIKKTALSRGIMLPVTVLLSLPLTGGTVQGEGVPQAFLSPAGPNRSASYQRAGFATSTVPLQTVKVIGSSGSFALTGNSPDLKTPISVIYRA